MAEIVEDIPRPAAAAPEEAGGSSAGEWYLVFCLGLVCLLGFMDRYTLQLIATPIMQDLGITKVQMSLLVGISFIGLYSVLSIPMGYLADLIDRRKMLATAGILWSCMSISCGLAGSYSQLFLGRVGLGVGEAALPPGAYSLIRDGVRPARRARAFGFYQLGGILGSSLGAIVGGFLLELGAKGAFAGVPILGALKPWQLVLAVPGICGIPICLLLLTVREPPRRVSENVATATFGELAKFARGHWQIYLPLALSSVFGGIGLSGWQAWLPTAINTVWSLPIPEIGKTFGSITFVASPLSVLVLSYLMDRFTRGHSPAGAVWVAFVGGAISLVLSLCILLAPSTALMWTALAGASLITGGFITAPATVISFVTPGRLIGKVTSFYYLVTNLLGFSIGPTLYAFVAEHMFTGPAALPHAMVLCYGILGSCGSACVFTLARVLGRWQPK